jgi:hypothetical protein
MTALKTSMVSLALCSLFTSSLVRADDCADALAAESCACRSEVQSNQERLHTSDAGSTADRQANRRKKERARRTACEEDHRECHQSGA